MYRDKEYFRTILSDLTDLEKENLSEILVEHSIINDYKYTIDELEEQVRDLERENDDLTYQIEDLEEEIEELKKK